MSWGSSRTTLRLCDLESGVKGLKKGFKSLGRPGHGGLHQSDNKDLRGFPLGDPEVWSESSVTPRSLQWHPGTFGDTQKGREKGDTRVSGHGRWGSETSSDGPRG